MSRKTLWLHPIYMMLFVASGLLILYVTLVGTPSRGMTLQDVPYLVFGVLVSTMLLMMPSYRVELLHDSFRLKYVFFRLMTVRCLDVASLSKPYVAIPIYVLGYLKNGVAAVGVLLKLGRERLLFAMIHEKNPDCRLDSKILKQLGLKVRLVPDGQERD